MRMFDVQGVEISASRGKVFEFLATPATCRNGLTHSSRPRAGVPDSKRPQEQWMSISA